MKNECIFKDQTRCTYAKNGNCNYMGNANHYCLEFDGEQYCIEIINGTFVKVQKINSKGVRQIIKTNAIPEDLKERIIEMDKWINYM